MPAAIQTVSRIGASYKIETCNLPGNCYKILTSYLTRTYVSESLHMNDHNCGFLSQTKSYKHIAQI